MRLLRTALEALVLGVLPAVLVAAGLLAAATNAGTMGDFNYLRAAAGKVAEGESPYVAPERLAEEGEFVYPPVVTWLAAPLAQLDEEPAQAIYYLLAVAAILGALWLLGVRDWRCYPVAFLSGATIACLKVGTLGPFLLLGIAAAWRLRDRSPTASAAVLGLTVVAKPFTWPLLAWPALRGRPRESLVAVAAGALAALAGWAAIGFAGLGDYVELLRETGEIWGPVSYSATALLVWAGLPYAAASALALAAGLALVAAAWVAARRTPLSDALLLTACLAAALLATPILWEHYLVLLLAPVALARPRLSPLWFAPLALELFVLPPWSDGLPERIVPLLVTTAAILALAGRAQRRAGQA